MFTPVKDFMFSIVKDVILFRMNLLIRHVQVLMLGFFGRRKQQMAALCHRKTDTGRQVLLITSSEGRWILPKGWPMKGKTGAETAAQEAWEEAGVKTARIEPSPVGSFQSLKRTRSGSVLPCETDVYAMSVKHLATKFPEAKRRKRRWVSIPQAMKIVDDPGLRKVLRQFQRA